MSVLNEVGMLLKALVLAMLKHEKSVWFQQVVFKDQIRNLCQFLQRIGRVGKDKVELLVAFLYVFEHIAFQRKASVGFHFIHYFAYERMVLRVFFYRYDPFASARNEFDADASGS